MRVHFIAIGGSAMHNMALALHDKGYDVSGSDDEIFEPSKSRLAAKGLLPEKNGWNPQRINTDLDAIILGMHARPDNPELLEAQRLGLSIYSYPEYVYEQSKNKTRVVIGGSHGKTSITSMILHVLQEENMEFDYLVGAQLEGFDNMVKLSEAPLIILEGDEYLSSPIDRRPKFLWYKPQIAVLSGIAWDHINVFPTFENYVEQFSLFIDSIQKGGSLIYYEGDQVLNDICSKSKAKIHFIPYQTHPNKIKNEQSYLLAGENEYAISIFGAHNLQNVNAAKEVCLALGISEAQFFKAIASFKGAAKRLELIARSENTYVYKDFAHSPSKLKATTAAVKKQYASKELIACMELHTFSSLNKAFLQEYKGSMDEADEAIVYFNPKTIAHKGLEELNPEDVRKAFLPSEVQVYTDSNELINYLKAKDWAEKVLLLMTSGNFDGVNLNEFGKSLLDH